MHLLAVIHLFPEVGYVKSKLRSHTVRQSLELCQYMQALRMDVVPVLDFLDLVINV